MSQFHALLLAIRDSLRNEGRQLLKLLPDLSDQLYRGALLLLGHFCREADQVEHLMEEAFRGGDAGLSPHFYVDWEIDLAG